MKSQAHKVVVPVGKDHEVPAVLTVPRQFQRHHTPAIILAHGSGSDMDDDLFKYLNVFLVARGFLTARFNFLYRARGRKAQDSDECLEQTLCQVMGFVRAHPTLAPGPLFLGGKSLGARIASQVATHHDAAGLVLMAYPLHAPGRPDTARDGHLSSLSPPCLFVSGTRDALAPRDSLQRRVVAMPRACVRWIDGGDHSFKMTRSSGVAAEDVWQRISEIVADWLQKPEA